MTTKQVKIYLDQSIKLRRKGVPAVALVRGSNTVDQDVAEHPFVKAHMLDDSEAAAFEGSNERVKELEAQLTDALQKNDEGEKLNAELKKQLDTLAKKDKAAARVLELEAQLVEKDAKVAELQSTVDAFTKIQ
jgi:chromosome segregation ATPase